MNLVRTALHEITWYGAWWLLFAAVAYCSARYMGIPGVVVGVLVVSATIGLVDVNWIFEEMREHPESGRDADLIFLFGVSCRMVLFNLVPLPVGIFGLRHRSRGRSTAHPTKVPLSTNSDSCG